MHEQMLQKKRLDPNIIALHHLLTILWFRELSFKRCISISCRRQEGATRRALHWWVGGTFSTNFGKRTIEGKVLPSKAGGGQAYIDLQGAHYLALKLFNVASSQISQQFLRDDNFTLLHFLVSRSPKRLQDGAAMLGTPAFVLQGSGENIDGIPKMQYLHPYISSA